MNHYPSLLIIMTGHVAHWFNIEETKAEHIATVDAPKSSYSDHEGQFSSSGAAGSSKTGNPEVINQEREAHLKQFCNNVAKKAGELWHEGNYTHLSLIIPDYLKNQAGEPIAKKTGVTKINYLFGNHHHADKNQALALFKESIKIHPR